MSLSFLPWLLALFILAAGPGNSNAEVFSLSAPPGGIQTLSVEVKGIHPDYKRYGLEKAILTQHVARQLKDAGFELVPLEKAGDTPTVPLLRVDLKLVRAYSGYPYAISVKLIQKIQLAGPEEHFVPVITWSKSRTGFLRSINLPYLYDYSTEIVKQFIKAAQAGR